MHKDGRVVWLDMGCDTALPKKTTTLSKLHFNWGRDRPSGRLHGSETGSLPVLPTPLIGCPPLEPWPLTSSRACDLEWSASSQALVCVLPALALRQLFLSARLSPAGEGWWGEDGEQKCQRDIKQSASVCALMVQPVWFPSPPSSTPTPSSRLLYIRFSAELWINSLFSRSPCLFVFFAPSTPLSFLVYYTLC